ncbi:MAG: hypothetical protein ACRCYP_07195 [Alphaproteobacteria bacterium]
MAETSIHVFYQQDTSALADMLHFTEVSLLSVEKELLDTTYSQASKPGKAVGSESSKRLVVLRKQKQSLMLFRQIFKDRLAELAAYDQMEDPRTALPNAFEDPAEAA